MEIEALESILMADMRKLPDDSGDGIASIANCAQYQIEISAYGDNDSVPEDEDEDDAVLGLVFAHSETYPDEPPSLKCRSVRGLREHELADIGAKVMKQATESVGAPMIFDLVQTCKEWMRRRVGGERRRRRGNRGAAQGSTRGRGRGALASNASRGHARDTGEL